MPSYTLKIKSVQEGGAAKVVPSFFHKLKGRKQLADSALPCFNLAIEIPESVASDLVETIFGMKTNGRPVDIRMTTPREVKMSGVLV